LEGQKPNQLPLFCLLAPLKYAREKPWQFVCLAAFSVVVVLMMWPQYFATGDGACHAYNAKVWQSLLLNSRSNYANYFSLNKQVLPNYTSHILLVALTQFCSVALANKLCALLSIVCVFAGFVKLLTCGQNLKLNASLLLLLPLLLNEFLFRGFYNFLFGIGFYFFAFSFAIDFLENKMRKTLLLFAACAAACYLSHAMAFICLLLSIGVYGGIALLHRTLALRRFAMLLLVCLPFCALLWHFASQQEHTELFPEMNISYWWRELQNFTCLVTTSTNDEDVAAVFAALLYFALFAAAAITYLNYKGINILWSSAVLLFIIFSVLSVLINDAAIGGGYVKARLQWLSGFMAVYLIAKSQLPKLLHTFVGLAGLVLFATLACYKWQPIQIANSHIKQLVQTCNAIKYNSFVLPLSFHHNGVFEGKQVSHRVPIVPNHAAMYLAEKQGIIFANNYEAATNYFPLVWQQYWNPYIHLPGLEQEPPDINLTQYLALKGSIDYVLLFNIKPQDKQTWQYNKLMQELQAYTAISISADSSMYLYEYSLNRK
jgi:hypothetical protein